MPEAALARRARRLARAGALRALALGDDPREVVPDEAAKSVGAEDTFGEDSPAARPSSASSSRRQVGSAAGCGPRGSTGTSSRSR